MSENSICVIDKDLPMNELFYVQLVNKMEHEGMSIHVHKEVKDAPHDAILLLAVPQAIKGLDNSRIVVGLRTINRKERMEIAQKVVPESLMARWASPEDHSKLNELLNSWELDTYVFKYDWSAGRRGVKLLHCTDLLPEDYNANQDIVMEYLDDDPYTYKAELCCGVLLNAWFLRTVPISEDNFNLYTRNPSQYDLPDDTRGALEKLSMELMRYGSGYISVDMMQYKGFFKIIEINTNSVGRNISWKHFGETYLDTYPEGLKQLQANISMLPSLGHIRSQRNQSHRFLPPI